MKYFILSLQVFQQVDFAFKKSLIIQKVLQANFHRKQLENHHFSLRAILKFLMELSVEQLEVNSIVRVNTVTLLSSIYAGMTFFPEVRLGEYLIFRARGIKNC